MALVLKHRTHPPRKFTDYDVNVDDTDLPAGIRLHRK